MPRPISRSAWMATAAVLIAAFIAAAWWWNGGAWGGPRFLGRPARAWFPRYAYDGRWGEDDAQRRWSQLTGAGAEIMPMLLAAVRDSGDESVARYSSLRRTAPSEVQVWLPEAVAGDELRREIGQILRHLVRKPEALRAFASVYASFPAVIQLEVLRDVPTNAMLRQLVVPLCLPRVAETNPALATTCAARLIDWSADDPGLTSRWLGDCVAWPKDWWTTNPSAFEVAANLMRLGTNAGVAEPMFRDWLESGNRHQRACAALTLPAIAPWRHSLSATLARVLPGLGPRDWAAVLPAGGSDPRWASLDWTQVLSSLLPLLDSDPVDGSSPVSGGTGLDPVLRLARELGPRATPVRSRLPRLLLSSNPVVAITAANLLATLGPDAHEPLAPLIAALDRGAVAPSLVLLLAAHGPAAGEAVPALARFAAGELPGDLDLVRRGTDGTGRGFRRAGWTFESDATTPGDAGPRVVADLAWRTGRTNEWPLPEAQRKRTDLQWRAWSASMGVPGISAELMRRYGLGPTNTTLGDEVVAPVTLRVLAAEALRRIEGGIP